jgi:myo-inositol-1(or 4)-monophosphatase
MASYAAEREVMVRAVLQAGASLVRDFARLEKLQISEKAPSDFVSSADLDAQEALRAALSTAYPDYDLLLEEGAPLPLLGESRFVVDPLDGTTNFLHAIPYFAVSVALEVKGETVVAVVLNPVTQELFWAEKNGGAWLGDRRLVVSPQKELCQCIVGTGIPHHGRPGQAPFLAALAKVMPEVAGIRRFGAAALDLAYVAAGRLDMFWEQGLAPWDVAAGQLLVREAGGIVTKRNGDAMRIGDGDILATSGEPLHGRAVALLAPPG